MNHSSPPSAALSRSFASRRALGDIVHSLDLALDNLRIAPRVRCDEGARAVRIHVGDTACITIGAVGSFESSISITAASGENRVFGALVAAVRSLHRVREVFAPRRACAREARRVVSKVAPAYDTHLRRLGISAGASTLAEFLKVVARELPGRIAIPAKVLRQAEACVFRRSVELARIVANILLSKAVRLPYKDRFASLPGFRLNLSETQHIKYREDYVAFVEGHAVVGELHCTLGNSFSQADCASVHWGYLGGKVVVTRIGRHGRNAQSRNG